MISRSVGARYLAVLLANPDTDISAVDLASGEMGTSRPRGQQLLDEHAKTAYRARVSALQVAIEQADRTGDAHASETAQHELDLLLDELAKASGLGLRSRVFTDDAERARVAVYKAIRRTLEAIKAEDAAIGGLLESRLSTGLHCRYSPSNAAM